MTKTYNLNQRLIDMGFPTQKLFEKQSLREHKPRIISNRLEYLIRQWDEGKMELDERNRLIREVYHYHGIDLGD